MAGRDDATSRRRFWWTQAGILVGAVVVYFGVRTLTEGAPSTASRNAGRNLLMGIALFREGRRLWVRLLGCLLPLTMALSVVVTANHYLLDVAVGMSIVVGALYAATRLHSRRQGRHLVLTRNEPYPRPAAEPVAVPPLVEKRAS